jgi:tripartite-type tricarboxylate transporter receptor subunit TctC
MPQEHAMNDADHARLRFALALAALVCIAAPALAEYPEKPVTIIVPVGPGAGPDVIARILADRLSQQWKQQVLIVNRPGGSGIIGAQAAIQAAPDGYTLYMPLSSAFAILPESKVKLPVDLATDFATIGLIGEQPMFFAVTPKLGAGTLPEFIALAKQKPGTILYGASRLSVPHMTGAYLEARAGIKLGYVPTTGAAKVVQDIMSGNLHMVVDSAPGMAGALQTGEVKALAVASDKRLEKFPDVPTVSDTLPNFQAKGWFVLVAPVKTPEAVTKKLGDDLRTALRNDDLRRRFEVVGTFPRPSTVEETTAFIKAEQAQWRPIVRQIGTE